MVFFSCDGCAEMLKKNQVDGHARKCRRCHSVSCVDCNVSFYGDDFRAHTSCVTEVERYEKKSVNNGASAQKGRREKVSPQQAWTDLIHQSVTLAPPRILPHLQTMSNLDNVPRKAKAFINFTTNSLNLRGKGGEATVQEIWQYLNSLRDQNQAQAAKTKQQQSANTSTTKDTSAVTSTVDVADANQPAVGSATVTTTTSNASSSSGAVAVTKAKDAPSSNATASVTIDKKTVKKAMKSCLKAKSSSTSSSLTLAKLRLLVRKRLALSVDDKPMLKKLIRQALSASTKTFVVQGKMVSLQDDKV